MESVLKALMSERGILRTSGAEANKLTRECLQTALARLMSEKPIDKISITELVKISGVSRQSFYRNYQSKEDILEDISKSIRDMVYNAVRDRKYLNNSYQWFCDLFQFIKKNKETVSILHKASQHQTTGIAFMPSILEIFRTDSSEKNYRLASYDGGLNAVIREWFANGMKEKAEKMAEICDTFYGEIHRELMKEIV